MLKRIAHRRAVFRNEDASRDLRSSFLDWFYQTANSIADGLSALHNYNSGHAVNRK